MCGRNGLFEPSLGSSNGLACYSLHLHNPGAGGCCARHLLAFNSGWNCLVTHPHVSLSRAYIGEMFVEIMRAFNLSLVSYSLWLDDNCVFMSLS